MQPLSAVSGLLILAVILGLANDAAAVTPCDSNCIFAQHTALNKLSDLLNGQLGREKQIGVLSQTPLQHQLTAYAGVYCCSSNAPGTPCTMPTGANFFTDCPVPCGVLGVFLSNNNLVNQVEVAAGDIWRDLSTWGVVNLQG